MSDPVADKVVSLVASVKHIPAEKVSLESNLADLGFDSLDTISLLFELESAFSVTIPDDKARAVRSVSEIVAGIHTLLENPPAATAAAGAAPLSSETPAEKPATE
jgi:acyl carrier protein